MAKTLYKQGIFRCENPLKYRGPTPIYYRSSLELRLQRWLDRNSKVLSWGAEAVVVPYLSPKDGKIHRYFIDNVLTLQTDTGPQKYIVEVKPFKQTSPPVMHGNKKRETLLYEQITWAVNQKKWESAKAWADKNGYKFIIITEKDLRE